ncbi:MAG: GAF domain-containing protein [Candidatus Nanopelagicales bacterium]
MDDPVDPPGPGRGASNALRPLPAVAEAVIDVVYESDADGTIRWVSPSVRQVLGWAPQDLVGRRPEALVHPDDTDTLRRARALASSAGQPAAPVPVRFRCSSGQYRRVHVTARPMAASDGAVEGAVEGAIVTLQDTSRYDAAVRALATLGECNRALARATDEPGLLQSICDIIVASGGYSFAWYGMPLNDAAQSVHPVAANAAEAGYLDEVSISWGDNPQGRGPTGECIRTGIPQVRNVLEGDPSYLPWHDAAARHGFRSSIALPVFVHGEIDGALMVYAPDLHAFDDDAHWLMTVLAADLGLGIERLRSMGEVRRQRLRLQDALQSQFDPFVLLEAVRDEDGAIVDFRFLEASDAAIDFN